MISAAAETPHKLSQGIECRQSNTNSRWKKTAVSANCPRNRRLGYKSHLLLKLTDGHGLIDGPPHRFQLYCLMLLLLQNGA